jgi:hypothetical protein
MFGFNCVCSFRSASSNWETSNIVAYRAAGIESDELPQLIYDQKLIVDVACTFMKLDSSDACIGGQYWYGM